MPRRTMQHLKREEPTKHQLEDKKSNTVGGTERVERSGKAEEFIYHKYRSARHALYPTEEAKTLETL